MVLIVLIQQGKGADMGATFGGSSNTLFGASGADNFLTKLTTMLAAAFMITSVTLAIQAKNSTSVDSGRLFKAAPLTASPTVDVVTPENLTPQAETTGSNTSPVSGVVVNEPAAAEAKPATEVVNTAQSTSAEQ